MFLPNFFQFIVYPVIPHNTSAFSVVAVGVGTGLQTGRLRVRFPKV